MSQDDFLACSFTPEPREGAAFGTFKQGSNEKYVLFGGRDSGNSIHYNDTWYLTLSPFQWQKVSTEDQVTNNFGAFIQQVVTSSKERTLLVGGLDAEGFSDNATFQRDFDNEVWKKLTFEDKIESSDQTPDTVDYLGVINAQDTKGLASDIIASIIVSWDSGFGLPFKYYHPNTNQWRGVPRRDQSKLAQAYGSYIWTEYPDGNIPCRMYILGGFDKNGNVIKQFQKVDFRYDSNQPPPFPPNRELFYYTNHQILADANDALFTIDPDTPLFEGDPIVADGIGNIRLANNSESRINVPDNDFTKSSCNPLFPLNIGVWDDELGYLASSDLETHVLIPFSSFAEVRLIELYIIKSTSEIKVKIPLEDFDPHPSLPQTRVNASYTPINVDSSNRCSGFLMFGGMSDAGLHNDLWKVEAIDIGTETQRYIWSRLI